MARKKTISRHEPSKRPPLGASFYKADLHVHSPASHDFRDKKVTPEQLVRAAEQAGLGIIAVTDHNSADWIDPLRKASKGSTVKVIPGVEISTPEGHILALFETDYEAGKMADLLVGVGIPREKHGQEEAISTDHAEQVIKKVHGHGGLSIAAHANSSNGLLKAKGQYKLGLVPMPELAALELSKQDEIERFCAGKVSQDYPAKACTHSSDSHSLAELGCRVVYLKMHEPSLWGIRQALLDYEVKVRFPWNYVEAAHPRIISLSVDQGFFGGQQFLFHDGLNCLVGGQGTGKSTVVELLRYCFDSSPRFEHSRADHESKIESLVGEGGLIQVRYVDDDGEEKVITREVQPWKTSREARDSTGNPTSLQASPAFFSQGELVEIARTPIAQLDLLDRHLDLDTENESEREAVDSLRTNADTLVALQRRERVLREEIDHPETGLAATNEKYGRLERRLKEPILKEFPLWEAEQTYLRDLQDALRRLPTKMKELMADFDLDGLGLDLPEGTPEVLSRVVDRDHDQAASFRSLPS